MPIPMPGLRRRLAGFLDRVAPAAALALRAQFHLRRGEPEVSVARRLVDPARRSIDVGANRGIYSYWFQAAGGPVTAVEPFPECVELLRRSFGTEVDVLAAACSDMNGTAKLSIPGAPSGPVSYRATLQDGTRDDHTVEVKTIRLDDTISDPVGLMKIDVEGHEQEVLTGADRLVREHRPTVVIEVEERHRSGAPQAVLAWFEERQYVGFYLSEGQVHHATEFDASRMQRLTPDGATVAPYVNNFIFVPTENKATRETVENIGAG